MVALSTAQALDALDEVAALDARALPAARRYGLSRRNRGRGRKLALEYKIIGIWPIVLRYIDLGQIDIFGSICSIYGRLSWKLCR